MKIKKLFFLLEPRLFTMYFIWKKFLIIDKIKGIPEHNNRFKERYKQITRDLMDTLSANTIIEVSLKSIGKIKNDANGRHNDNILSTIKI
jgi:hypothetical protein